LSGVDLGGTKFLPLASTSELLTLPDVATLSTWGRAAIFLRMTGS
jgi:hypothetical protein